MSRVLVYTSPARGHIEPLLATLDELQRRGHTVAVRTLASEVTRVAARGMTAAAIDPAIELREIDDWRAGSAPAALLAACRTFVDRGRHEIDDLRRAIAAERPDLLFTDVNCWGAGAAAEASGLPWAVFAPYFLPVQAPGAPPWGLGVAPMPGAIGRVRDRVLWSVVNALYDRALPGLNALRATAGVPPLRHVAAFATRAPGVIAYTAEPFAYAHVWPDNVRLVGPALPDDAGGAPAAGDAPPLVLVTCSTEFQDDRRIIEVALEALADQDVRVVATSASIDPTTFRAPPNARVERYLPHGPLLREASCVVCHGGMGITQKALAAGVPVCVIPFGRDQLEVARHVVVAGAGTRVTPRQLTPERLRRAVRETIACAPGAERVAEGFRRAGGVRSAADALEALTT